MRAQIQYFFYIFALTIALSSCATMPAPETNLERLSYLEISYGVILSTATLYANENKLTAEMIEKLDKAFDAYEEAARLAHLAIDTANQIDFNNQAAAITSILATLRTVLAEVEQ